METAGAATNEGEGSIVPVLRGEAARGSSRTYRITAKTRPPEEQRGRPNTSQETSFLSAATPPLSAAERIICLQVVDGKLDSPNVDTGYKDILRSGSLPF
jgi:hypothetical protein